MRKIRKNSTFKTITLSVIGLLGLSFFAGAFNITTNLMNTLQYIRQIVLTSDGSNTGTTGIVLDGTNGNIISA